MEKIFMQEREKNIELTRKAEEKGWLVPTKDKLFWLLTPKMTKLIKKINNTLMEEIGSPNGFEEWIFPRIIPEKALDLTGWLEHHPSEAYLVNSLPTSDYFPHRHLLDPIQCISLYYCYSDKLIDTLPIKIVESMGGWTFRNERHENLEGFFKMKSFLRTEFVWICEEKDTVQIRNNILEDSLKILSNRFGLPLIKAKGDSCFLESPPSSTEPKYSVIGASVIQNTPTIDIAFVRKDPPGFLELASGSVGGSLIPDKFQIKSKKNSRLGSGCFGFGLTRIAFVILEQTNFEYRT